MRGELRSALGVVLLQSALGVVGDAYVQFVRRVFDHVYVVHGGDIVVKIFYSRNQPSHRLPSTWVGVNRSGYIAPVAPRRCSGHSTCLREKPPCRFVRVGWLATSEACHQDRQVEWRWAELNRRATVARESFYGV